MHGCCSTLTEKGFKLVNLDDLVTGQIDFSKRSGYITVEGMVRGFVMNPNFLRLTYDRSKRKSNPDSISIKDPVYTAILAEEALVNMIKITGNIDGKGIHDNDSMFVASMIKASGEANKRISIQGVYMNGHTDDNLGYVAGELKVYHVKLGNLRSQGYQEPPKQDQSE